MHSRNWSKHSANFGLYIRIIRERKACSYAVLSRMSYAVALAGRSYATRQKPAQNPYSAPFLQTTLLVEQMCFRLTHQWLTRSAPINAENDAEKGAIS